MKIAYASGLLALLVFLLQAATPSAVLSGDLATVGKLKVCLHVWEPYVYYTRQGDISGYEIDLFYVIVGHMGWGGLYEFVFVPQSDIAGRLVLPMTDPLACHLALSMPVTTALQATGIVFSNPTFRAGYRIVARVYNDNTDMWAFAKVFGWDVWLTLVGTSVILGLVIFVSERDMIRRGSGKSKYGGSVTAAMVEAQYRVICKIFNGVNDLAVTSIASKIISICWSFLIVVLIATYTASLTATLTADNSYTVISTAADLRGKNILAPTNVWSVPSLMNTFEDKFNFRATPVPVTNASQLYDVISRVVGDGAVDGAVMDNGFARLVSSKDCRIRVVDRMIYYIDQAVGFNLYFPVDQIRTFDVYLNGEIEKATYEELEAAHIPVSNICQNTGGALTVSLSQISGVWVLLAISMAVSCFIMILPHINKRMDLDVITRVKSQMTRLKSGLGSTHGDHSGSIHKDIALPTKVDDKERPFV